jgi:hypothetical protein
MSSLFLRVLIDDDFSHSEEYASLFIHELAISVESISRFDFSYSRVHPDIHHSSETRRFETIRSFLTHADLYRYSFRPLTDQPQNLLLAGPSSAP